MKKLLLGSVAIAALSLTINSASADTMNFTGNLSGAQEVVFDGDAFVPGGTDTLASGVVSARFDKMLSKVIVTVRARMLQGSFSGAHFHCALPGQNGPVVFGMVSPGPLMFVGDSIRGELTNTDFTGADCSASIGRPVNNIASLKLAMEEGLIYANVHTSAFRGGEIRGQMAGNR